MARGTPQARSLQGRYYSRLGQLHGASFYDRRQQETKRRIREILAYVNDAQAIIGA